MRFSNRRFSRRWHPHFMYKITAHFDTRIKTFVPRKFYCFSHRFKLNENWIISVKFEHLKRFTTKTCYNVSCSMSFDIVELVSIKIFPEIIHFIQRTKILHIVTEHNWARMLIILYTWLTIVHVYLYISELHDIGGSYSISNYVQRWISIF